MHGPGLFIEQREPGDIGTEQPCGVPRGQLEHPREVDLLGLQLGSEVDERAQHSQRQAWRFEAHRREYASAYARSAALSVATALVSARQVMGADLVP